ncbi:unnamed protein product [Symbiodinium necroappetens]|uniref:Uncharacterized protein n=1 Tax=Symbiodinium necroappetens TaxID=1628268 RepID=A0A813C1P9_9DINO|nr:unnamed protein product [Symbiodinium necroappetens]
MYEDLPSDPFSLFRCLTATQAWTVACTEAQVAEAGEALMKAWQTTGLREEPLEAPEIIKPQRRDLDVGGGFGDTGFAQDDTKWDELSDDDESDEEAILGISSKIWDPAMKSCGAAVACKLQIHLHRTLFVHMKDDTESIDVECQAKQTEPERESANRDNNDSAQLMSEAQHMAPNDDEKQLLDSPRDISVEEGGDPPEDGEEPAEEIGGTFEYADNFREMMMYSAEDKKADTFVPIAGNTYRFWGLGIPEHRFTTQNFGVLSILLVQVLSPPACIIYNLYKLDWEGWHFGLSDWYYIPNSDEHGVSNLSKHIVATAFLIMFTLNGAMVVDNERIASLKITALLDAPAIKHKPGFLKDVNLFWLNVGRVLNCVVVIECCLIVYFAFVLSENPMDVVFNALAVTFLYNLDDIGGETGFLTEDDWDGDELGKIYYHAVDALMTDNEQLNPDGYTPDEINSCNQMRDKYGSWTYRIAEPLCYLLVILLPMAYIFIDELKCKPSHLKLAVMELQKEVAALKGGGAALVL